MKPFLYGLQYVVDYRLLGKPRPLIRGLVLTNRCNLRCRHCTITARGPMDLSYPEVTAAIDAFYDDGEWIRLSDRGAFWLHAVEDLFSTDYVGKLWGASRKEPWPDRVPL